MVNNIGGEWYLEKRGCRKILTGSRNLESVFGKSRSLVFAWLHFYFFEFRNFTKESRARIFNKDLGVSASLGFYHSPPLNNPSPSDKSIVFLDPGISAEISAFVELCVINNPSSSYKSIVFLNLGSH